MKKSYFLSLCLAALTFGSCGDSKQVKVGSDEAVAADSVVSVEGLSEGINSTLTALQGELTSCIEKKDVSAVVTTLANMQVIYKNLVEKGKLEEAKVYGDAIKTFVSENAEQLKEIARGNTTVSSLIEGVKNLPTSAEATVDEAKKAVVSDIVNLAAPSIAKGETTAKAVTEAVEAVQNAPENIKAAATEAANKAVSDAKANASQAANNAKAAAAEKVNSEVEKAANAATEKINSLKQSITNRTQQNK